MKDDVYIFILGFFIGLLFGSISMEIMTVKRMRRENLEGYKAKAIYSTNNLGEIKIDEIKWTK